MKIVGITGTTGSGKTSALELLKKHGAAVLDCDAIYHKLLEQSAEMLNRIENRFPGVVKKGVLDRKALGKIVFADAALLEELNGITHGFVREEVLRQLDAACSKGVSMAAIDAIALFESGLDKLCDKTVAVTANDEARVARLMAREGISEEYARARISAQRTNASFSAQCDYLLENNGSREDFMTRCDRCFKEIFGGDYHE